MGGDRKSGPIRTLFSSIRPSAKTRLFTKFDENILKLED